MDKEKYIDNSWRARMVEKGIYKDSEITLEENQVKEMPKSCKNCICNAVCDKKLNLRYYFDNHDCEHYQPKLPEDSVVLSKEEYGLLINDLDKGDYGEFESGFSQGYQDGSKETAEKILKWLTSKRHLFNRTHEEGFEKPRTSYLVLNDEIEELAKQFGVEIKG